MKKNFKKIAAVALSCVLTLGMTVNAFADEPNPANPDLFYKDYTPTPTGTYNKYDLGTTTSSSRDVKVTFAASSDTIYRVDVAWDSLVFEYEFTGDSKWNPDNHTFGEGSWKDGGVKSITVTNHSNDEISYSAKFGTSDNATKNGVTATLSNNEKSIESAVGTTFTDAPKKVISVTLEGDPTVNALAAGTGFTVGTVTVTITP